jgi:hypothetical protein
MINNITTQTHVSISALSQQLSYKTPVLLVGSCFADNVGQIMQQYRFSVTVNPFGTVYNPLSIAQSLLRLQSAQLFTEEEIVQSGDLFTSFFHHSKFAHPDKKCFLEKANTSLLKGAEAFRKAEFIILSLGTARVYHYKESGAVVNNCHKIPAAAFTHTLLSVEDVVTTLSPLIKASTAQWILTVSPIRHWKDGAHGNQLSKSTLLLAVEQLQQAYANVHYFPAYEIMMDELRDYRFYADDMLHPSPLAINYIWQRFAEAALTAESKIILSEVEKIVTAQQHRLLHPSTESSRLFQQRLRQQIADFTARHPDIQL